ncbi:tetratricopeptide repeat protein [Asanoa sp. NPDC049518]|uniref:tetratricopeptide repeat protein n=1 Tax=unclassified Asanoa TaxID=2685164 RepID=UPI00341A2D97
MGSKTSALDSAVALVRQGQLAQAEDVMVREVQAVAAKHGRGSVRWAEAQCDLGTVLMNCDQLGRAVDAFRAAASVDPGSDYEARKDQITYRMNLGIVLRLAGRIEEAEAELRQGLRERLAFYGKEHAGYGFGLEPLAAVLLQRGNLAEARQVVDETVDNFWRNGHERVATAIALRGEIMAAGGETGPLFLGLDQLPEHVVEQVAAAVISQGQGNPAVLTDLAAALEARLGPDHQATLNVLSALANTGHGRVDAIQRVLASYDRQGRDEEALMATLGLALAQSDSGDDAGALASYESAYALANRLRRPELVSQTLRNWGLALKEVGQLGPAEQRLAEAVAVARGGADRETLGRAGVALGLFLQHEGRLSEAEKVIEEGLSALDPVHPDALIGRSHLGAVREGRTCGCGDLPSTISDAFRDFVMAIPQDLLADLRVTIVDHDFKIDVELRREPAKDELERLNEVVQSAHAEFRRRITTRS